MKTIGIIGGISWYSTVSYYKAINQLTNERLGGSHSARILLYSVDFQEIRDLQDSNDWDSIEKMLTDIALRLQQAGADLIIIASNTPHLVADEVSKKINIPLLHIAEETGREIARQGIKKVALLGTQFTMENDFFKNKLTVLGIETLIPESKDREYVHTTIFGELARGIIKEDTRKGYADIISRLQGAGAEGVIFGCTEIALLLSQEDCVIPVFDTTTIHCRATVDRAL